MNKKLSLLLFLPLLLTSCEVIDTKKSTSTQVSDTLSGAESLSQDTEDQAASVDPYPGLEGQDLLFAIFDSYASKNLTVEQEGVCTEYYMEKGYAMVYDDNYKQYYDINDYGFIINPVQGVYDYTLKNGQIAVSSALTYKTDSDFFYSEFLNSPVDLIQWGEYTDVWHDYDPENPPKFKDGELVSASSIRRANGDSTETSEENGSLVNPTGPSRSEADDDREARYVCYTTDADLKLIAAIQGQMPLSNETDADGNTLDTYDVSGIDMVKVRINQDYSLTFLVSTEGFNGAIYTIKNVNTTAYQPMVDYFNATEDDYTGKTDKAYGKLAPTSWTLAQAKYFRQNFGDVMPFPEGASYTFRFYSGGSSMAAFSDDVCGDITESYTKQLTDAGWLFLDESGLSETQKTETGTTYYKNLTEDGSKQVRVSFNYAAPNGTNARWDKGTFIANIHLYPHTM